MSLDEPSVPKGVHGADVVAWRGGAQEIARDWLAEEAPVALVFNGTPHAVMLATPCDLEDFALGFCMSEGLLVDRAELWAVRALELEEGIELRLDVSSSCERRVLARRRSLSGRTGCGLCGIDSLAAVHQPLPTLEPVRVQLAAIARAQRELLGFQERQKLTGATHAAAWCDLEGAVRLAREDVGRHNALDKAIGALLRAGHDVKQGFLCVTSRASFEMVQKSAQVGVATLAAVSAPTTMAVNLARQCGQLLAGFVRGDDLVAYTHPERLGLGPR